ncbi:MAG: dihydrolipoamide acetyltransferase family protein [Spirochaetia bacterium]|jgi:pyruvate dehydrogenase E2 component (dihydrolipoamide acetyltransferase)
MASSVIMPKAGMAMETGTIIRWFKNVGDPVTAGEPLLEIQTDKVAMEVEAEVSGYLIAVLRKPGDEVAVTEPIAFIGAKDEKPPTGAPTPAVTAAPGRVAPTQAAGPAAGGAPAPASGRGLMATPAARRRAGELGVALQSVAGTGPEGEIRLRDVEAIGVSPLVQPVRSAVSPLARKVAEQQGLDPSALTGTGPGGRILRQDVTRALAGQRGPAAKAGSSATRTPLSGTRKIIAQRMLQSHLSIPQFTLDTQADVTSLLALRARMNHEAGMAISVNDFVMKATAAALADSPFMLRSIDGEELVEYHAVNLGMAVALETGLIVPVIRSADKLSLSALAREAAELVRRARERKLTPDEMLGGTFTVSNLGMYGITSFTPLINPPEGAILGVNAARTEVYLDAGQPKERRLMTLSLSVDHRVIDGAQGALFLQKLVALLEEPYRALI